MKNIKLCIICFILSSCNPTYDTSYFLENNSPDTININFYNKENDVITYKIAPNSNSLFLRIVGIASGPSKMSLSYNDSIFVIKNDTTIKFYRDNELKNQIYLMSNWVLTKNEGNIYEYTYSFNKEDFN